jgi:hypothetical protein
VRRFDGQSTLRYVLLGSEKPVHHAVIAVVRLERGMAIKIDQDATHNKFRKPLETLREES